MGFFKLYKPKKYNYRYIYYDPKKEAQKERDEKYGEKEIDEKGEFKTSIRRGSFREQRNEQNKAYKDNVRQANIRLVIIIAVLFLIVYFIMR